MSGAGPADVKSFQVCFSKEMAHVPRTRARVLSGVSADKKAAQVKQSVITMALLGRN